MYLALNVFCSGGIEQVSQVANQSDSLCISHLLIYVFILIFMLFYIQTLKQVEVTENKAKKLRLLLKNTNYDFFNFVYLVL